MTNARMQPTNKNDQLTCLKGAVVMVYRISDKQNNRKAQAGKTSEPQKPWDAICTNHTKYVFTCFWRPVNGYPTHYKTLSSVDQHNVHKNTSLGSAGPDAIAAHEPWRILPLCAERNGRATGELGRQNFNVLTLTWLLMTALTNPYMVLKSKNIVTSNPNSSLGQDILKTFKTT